MANNFGDKPNNIQFRMLRILDDFYCLLSNKITGRTDIQNVSIKHNLQVRCVGLLVFQYFLRWCINRMSFSRHSFAFSGYKMEDSPGRPALTSPPRPICEPAQLPLQPWLSWLGIGSLLPW